MLLWYQKKYFTWYFLSFYNAIKKHLLFPIKMRNELLSSWRRRPRKLKSLGVALEKLGNYKILIFRGLSFYDSKVHRLKILCTLRIYLLLSLVVNRFIWDCVTLSTSCDSKFFVKIPEMSGVNWFSQKPFSNKLASNPLFELKRVSYQLKM